MLNFYLRLHHVGLPLRKQVVLSDESLVVTQPIVVLWCVHLGDNRMLFNVESYAVLIIYGIKNCSTMKKAFDFLDQAGVAYQFFDYKKQIPTVELLRSWTDQLGLEVVINKRGTTWRKLTDEQKNQAESINTAITLLQAQPSMIKRPIITDAAGTVVLVGFDETTYQAALIKP